MHFSKRFRGNWNLQSCLGAEIKEKRDSHFGSNDYADVYYKSGLSSEEIEKYGRKMLNSIK